MKSRKSREGRVVLASASPQRRELLAQAGVRFLVRKSGFRERIDTRLSPARLVQKLALAKAKRVATKEKDAVVIGADSLVFLGGRVIGKPRNRAHARSILTALSGRMHRILTGYALLDIRDTRTLTRAVTTRVWFRDLSPREIERYVASGESLGAAGAYRAQRKGAKLIARMRGDKNNVVGLPRQLVRDLKRMIRRR